MRFFERLSHFLKGPNLLHPSNWEGHLSSMTFRRYQTVDFAECLEIYRQGDERTFPGRSNPSIRRESPKPEKILFCCRTAWANYRYGWNLVFRTAVYCHALFWPRAAQPSRKRHRYCVIICPAGALEPSLSVYRVYIAAVEQSFPFYQRFGFQPSGQWRDQQGSDHPLGCLVITDTEIHRCRRLLAEHGISIPSDESQVTPGKKKETPSNL